MKNYYGFRGCGKTTEMIKECIRCNGVYLVPTHLITIFKRINPILNVAGYCEYLSKPLYFKDVFPGGIYVDNIESFLHCLSDGSIKGFTSVTKTTLNKNEFERGDLL